MDVPKIDKYNLKDEVKYVFYQLPKLLVHGKYYENILKLSDLVAYSILHDRMKVSKKNNWIDDEGNYYFIYTNKELSNVLKIGIDTVVGIKKRLSSVNLLVEERTGRANRLYLSKPQSFNDDEAKYILEINDTKLNDSTKFTEEEKQKLSEAKKKNKNAEKTTELGKSNISSQTPSQSVSEEVGKQENSENPISEVGKSNSSKKNLSRTKDLKDIKDQVLTEKSLFENSLNKSKENPDLENQLIDYVIKKNSLNIIYGDRLINLMKSYSFGSFSTFERYVNKVIAGNKEAEKEIGSSISFLEDEYFQNTLHSTFLNVVSRHKQGRVDSFENYLFSSFKSDFVDYSRNKQKIDEVEENKVPLANWVESYDIENSTDSEEY